MSVAVRIHDLSVAYRRHPAVHHLSGQFARGSLTAIVGPNGAGKSSLLSTIAGAVRPAAGKVEVLPGTKGCIAYLPQQSQVDRSFPIRVCDVVALGHWSRIGRCRAAGRVLRERTSEALLAVGLAGFERRSIAELSVGQFQRVLFARVLLQEAPLILLDEPFNAIDARTTDDLLNVIQRWHGESRTIIAVLHDLDQVRRSFPETLLLAREAIAWGATAEVLRAENLFRARQMAEGWLETAAACTRGDAG
jgi:zinc/manganese transport system ATP-binding protein